MTTPDDSPQVFDGIDIKIEPEDLKQPDQAATTDPEELTDEGRLGGAGGAGGAG
jgi:hypothetical protein